MDTPTKAKIGSIMLKKQGLVKGALSVLIACLVHKCSVDKRRNIQICNLIIEQIDDTRVFMHSVAVQATVSVFPGPLMP